MEKKEINWLKKIWEALVDLASARVESGVGGSQPAPSQPGASEDSDAPSASEPIAPMVIEGTRDEVTVYEETELEDAADGFIPNEDSPTFAEAKAWFLAGKPLFLRFLNVDSEVLAAFEAMPISDEIKATLKERAAFYVKVNSLVKVIDSTETDSLSHEVLVGSYGASMYNDNPTCLKWYGPLSVINNAELLSSGTQDPSEDEPEPVV